MLLLSRLRPLAPKFSAFSFPFSSSSSSSSSESFTLKKKPPSPITLSWTGPKKVFVKDAFSPLFAKLPFIGEYLSRLERKTWKRISNSLFVIMIGLVSYQAIKYIEKDLTTIRAVLRGLEVDPNLEHAFGFDSDPSDGLELVGDPVIRNSLAQKSGVLEFHCRTVNSGRYFYVKAKVVRHAAEWAPKIVKLYHAENEHTVPGGKPFHIMKRKSPFMTTAEILEGPSFARKNGIPLHSPAA